ncbi:hypothetical protein ACQCU1_02765 [Sutcliffiella horikoshii]|uniref:hypothetical protein n=1 Tax=Sutcliffiella horikoshii TaxID=79883 RepID=UPI003CF4C604
MEKAVTKVNEIWQLDSEYLAAYSEDENIMRKVKRSYPTFEIMATYQKEGRSFALQYRIPKAKKRAAYRLFR